MNSTTRVTWRLLVMMAERGIRTATDLQRRLQAIGVDISSAQLSRVINSRPQRLSLDLLEGLMFVLECDANALLDSSDGGRAATLPLAQKAVERTTPKAPPARRPRVRRKGANPVDVTGPKVTPFPVAKRT